MPAMDGRTEAALICDYLSAGFDTVYVFHSMRKVCMGSMDVMRRAGI